MVEFIGKPSQERMEVFKGRNIIDISSLTRDEIETIMQTAAYYDKALAEKIRLYDMDGKKMCIRDSPSEERLQKGPVAILECFQKIPCAPCVKACPQGAITIGEDINEIPTFNADKCIGCGQCIVNCPGQAIFVVDLTYSEDCACLLYTSMS